MTDLEHLDFAEGDLADEFVLLAVEEFLDGHQLAGFPVAALEHDPVGSLPDHAQLVVLIHGGDCETAFG